MTLITQTLFELISEYVMDICERLHSNGYF